MTLISDANRIYLERTCKTGVVESSKVVRLSRSKGNAFISDTVNGRSNRPRPGILRLKQQRNVGIANLAMSLTQGIFTKESLA